MMTTVVTTTTTTTTTATSVNVAAGVVDQAVAMGVVATILLLGLLVLKELLLAYASERRVAGSWRARAARAYASTLNIAIVPLLLVFALLVATRVVDVL